MTAQASRAFILWYSTPLIIISRLPALCKLGVENTSKKLITSSIAPSPSFAYVTDSLC